MRTKTKMPRKQRKRWYNQPLHRIHKSMAVHLSDDLLEKYTKRAIPIRKGDTVKVIRGIYKDHVAKIAKVDRKKKMVMIEEATITKADGKKVPIKFAYSNLIITKLDLSDPYRRRWLEQFRIEKKMEEEEEEEEEKEIEEEVEEKKKKETEGEK